MNMLGVVPTAVSGTEARRERALNSLKTGIMAGAVVGTANYAIKNPKAVSSLTTGAVGIAKKAAGFLSPVLNKMKPFTDKLKNTSVFKTLMDGVRKLSGKITQSMPQVKGTFLRILDKIAKNPKTAAFAGAALLAIGANHIYQSGKIDQKYGK